MFNFLFDGKIGDILAPIQSPIQQFHLAIQHFRNSEVLFSFSILSFPSYFLFFSLIGGTVNCFWYC